MPSGKVVEPSPQKGIFVPVAEGNSAEHGTIIMQQNAALTTHVWTHRLTAYHTERLRMILVAPPSLMLQIASACM